MKPTKPKPGDTLTLDYIQKRFSTPLKARKYLEGIRWPKGPVCPHCRNSEGIWPIAANKQKKVRQGLYECSACQKQFTVTVGTIFEDSKIPLHKWLLAFYLFSSSKKGISALQIKRMLGIGSYRTAHFMMHRIRHAVTLTGFEKPLGGTVEIDEVHLGGKARLEFIKGVPHSIVQDKMKVVSLVERYGRKRSFVLERVNHEAIKGVIGKNVDPNATIITDSSSIYTKGKRPLTLNHHRVNHRRKQYTLKVNDRLTAHTNTVESSFSLLRRGIVGTFHSIGKRYLPLYLAEFDHRWSYRDITDGARTLEGLRMTEGKRLKYGEPTKPLPAMMATNEQGTEQL